ncbi:hypothetical protein RclHR1_01240004 [Rhizophagus clarus]|uniref:Uncharacterized protein n=1 Tax=Rhizophagus clarus TaxID=94130 RepID=A0A2Z6Q754_9GLOM|nr:hypothetical protein RclHR1_01240004 [Rhizophagus clarus]
MAATQNAENERDQGSTKLPAINENQTTDNVGKKRKAADEEVNNVERWSDEKTVLKSKSTEDIKGRLSRPLDKYEKEKQENNKTDYGTIKWKWLEKMERIFRCHENVSPFVSNISTDYFGKEKEKEIKIDKKEYKRAIKKTKK